MRMQLLKIVVILLVAGTGDTRPQNGADSQPKTAERSDVGWRGVQISSKSHDIVRGDSRYTGTSGSNRKSYNTRFRGSVDSSREHNAVGSRASDFAPDATTRSFNSRRSKIDDIWTMPEFRAINAPPHFPRTDVLGEIAKIANVRSSDRVDGTSPHFVSPGNSKTIRNEKLGGTRFRPDLKVVRTDYSGKMNIGNLERSKSEVTSNENLESAVARTRYSYSTGNAFLASHASDFERTNDDISVAVDNRRNLNSIMSDSFATKGDTSPWKLEQGANKSFLQMAGMNVPSNFQVDDASVHKNRNSIRKNVDSIVIKNGNSKPSVVTDSSRRTGGNQRDGLNNSEKSAYVTETTLISNSKSEVVGHRRPSALPRKNAVTSHRNFVKLRYPYSISNQWNASHVMLNTKNSNDGSAGIELRQPAKGHFTSTAAKKPVGLNDHATSKPTENSHAQKLPSQEVDDGNKMGDPPVKYNNAYSKNWPNEALQGIEDLYNYEKYTSSLEDSSHESGLSDADGTPILSSNNYFDHTDPIIDSSVKKIIHWLKIPAIVPNRTEFFDYNDDYKSIEPIESIYENLEPNRPLNDYDDNYEAVVLQDVPLNQDVDKTDFHENFPIRWSSPSSIANNQYTTQPSSATFIPASWSDVASLRNKTVYNPVTHVTQNTVVHILNDGLKKPNVTVTQLKAPETEPTATDQAASSESSSESLGQAQRPNVHIMFTSQKDENKKPSKQEVDTIPSSTHANCPTIMINTYTRVNNTLQSKEGCTDLNIILNSHVSNVFTPPNGAPITENQQTSLATQSYGGADESEKYVEPFTDLSQMDSLDSYVTASTGTYDSSPLQWPQHNYYDSQKDPDEIPGQWNEPVQSSGLSTFEVFQGTQISLSDSSVPLVDAEATASPGGLSVDGPAVGPGDDASSSAVDPSAVGASASGSPVGSPDSGNPSAELPAYLIRPGPVKGQANNGLVPGSLQLPALPNLPSLPSIAVKPGASSVISPSSSPTSGSLTNNNDDDDDEDDLSPGGILNSIASVFTYFSFMNPLSYGFFSLAAAPFAAMAAGMLGVAAVVFPWAIPSVLDGRSADKTTGFVTNLEEFVRRAVHKYDRLNEWKSRRRKRRR